MTIGIYSLFWEDEDLYYIGQSVEIETRIKTHIRNMQQNIHSNYKVQKAFHSYGLPKYYILQNCLVSELDNLEEIWQKEFNSLSSLDIVQAGESHCAGLTNPRSKYTKLQILITYRLARNSALTSRDISNKTKVSLSMVDDIRSGRAHTWLQEKYPFTWSLIDARRSERRLKGYTRSAKKLGKEYTFIDKEGNEYIVSNFSKFGKEHGLDSSDLSRVASGKYKQTKGFRLKV